MTKRVSRADRIRDNTGRGTGNLPSSATATLWKRETLLELLTDLHSYAGSRIDDGDLDFDDWLYKSRDLSAQLIAVLKGPEIFSYEEDE